MIEFRGVSARRGKVQVLQDVHLRLDAAHTTLMGPNGAGKSTLMLVLLGLIPHTGYVEVDGRPVDGRGREWLDRVVGYAPQSVTWPGNLSPRGVCELSAWLRRVPRARTTPAVDRALVLSGTTSVADRPVRMLSGGQRRRVSLAQALVHEPRYLVLDEPTSELDPIFAEEFASTLADLRRDHVLLVSTHSIDDVSAWHGDVVVLADGVPEHLPEAEVGSDRRQRADTVRRLFHTLAAGRG